eukprot:9297820-Lingulodinium_polyedra.AAC.1
MLATSDWAHSRRFCTPFGAMRHPTECRRRSNSRSTVSSSFASSRVGNSLTILATQPRLAAGPDIFWRMATSTL